MNCRLNDCRSYDCRSFKRDPENRNFIKFNADKGFTQLISQPNNNMMIFMRLYKLLP